MASGPLQERVDEVDILRGLAVVGMLVWGFRSWSFGFFDPHEAGIDDIVCTIVAATNIQHTIYPLFAMLFGWGLGRQMRQADAISTSPVPNYIRRMSGLYLIGLAYYIFVDTTDILHTFAVYGLCLPLFVKRKTRTLLLAAICCIAFAIVGPVLFQHVPSDSAYHGGSRISLHEDMITSASYAAIVIARWHDLALDVSHPSTYVANCDILGSLLLGLYAARRRVFEDLPASVPFVRMTALLCLTANVVGTVWIGAMKQVQSVDPTGANARSLYRVLSAGDRAWILLPLVQLFAAHALSLFYAAAVLLLLQYRWVSRPLLPIACFGKLALTNYVLLGFIGTMLFYGYGLGLYGLGCAAREALAFSVLAVLLCFTVSWQRYCLWGPLEWAWRSFTLWTLLPMRRTISP